MGSQVKLTEAGLYRTAFKAAAEVSEKWLAKRVRGHTAKRVSELLSSKDCSRFDFSHIYEKFFSGSIDRFVQDSVTEAVIATYQGEGSPIAKYDMMLFNKGGLDATMNEPFLKRINTNMAEITRTTTGLMLRRLSWRFGFRVSDTFRQKGRILAVRPGSPAAKAGMKKGMWMYGTLTAKFTDGARVYFGPMTKRDEMSGKCRSELSVVIGASPDDSPGHNCSMTITD